MSGKSAGPPADTASSVEVSASSDMTYTRPRTRQRIRKTPAQLHVPDINDDAAERKRVLNVLAQRRYRERRRKGNNASDTSKKRDATTSSQAPSSCSQTPGASSSRSSEEAAGRQNDLELARSTEAVPLDMDVFLDGEIDPSWPATTAEFLAGPALSTTDDSSTTDLTLGAALGNDLTPSTIDPSILTAFSSSSPSTTSTSMTTPPSFPDTYLLPMPQLTLLKGLLRVAFRLGISSEIWHPQTLSPFYLGTVKPETAAALPASWRPTATQRTVPHHPVLDLLPWPAARDRMIQVLALPTSADGGGGGGGGGGEEDAELVGMMPMGGGAECDRALVLSRLVYDMEDGAEGLRIWGADPYEAGAWEVGQVVFERWWFMFDREIVDQSDRWREMRGAARLSLGRGGGGGGGNGMDMGGGGFGMMAGMGPAAGAGS
ncbi:uncharacterized protein E0L32_010737 [Thyridium curvatum]|uniref:BZIP domain-containing protein n=1 Tax=Thyridium curvatum TaxID=1093900 RepID=A0A507ADV8_9PEZI|nr:uncharacterized protein E0L32_010737 [Thyridium curvatum]TPX07315.1 hypothetical protein E0L32_010737 [Thyridium curvatum]